MYVVDHLSCHGIIKSLRITACLSVEAYNESRLPAAVCMCGVRGNTGQLVQASLKVTLLHAECADAVWKFGDGLLSHGNISSGAGRCKCAGGSAALPSRRHAEGCKQNLAQGKAGKVCCGPGREGTVWQVGLSADEAIAAAVSRLGTCEHGVAVGP